MYAVTYVCSVFISNWYVILHTFCVGYFGIVHRLNVLLACYFFAQNKQMNWIELFFFYSIENNLHNFLQSTNDLFHSFVEFHDKCVDFEWSLFVAAVAAACRTEWIAVALFLWWKLRHVKLELKTTSELNTKLD